ncbi:unnamed protein product, partial [Sphacelaria rigidula]
AVEGRALRPGKVIEAKKFDSLLAGKLSVFSTDRPVNVEGCTIDYVATAARGPAERTNKTVLRYTQKRQKFTNEPTGDIFGHHQHAHPRYHQKQR